MINSLIKRASVYHQQEQLEKSYEDLKKAEQIDPNSSEVYHHRAQVNTILSYKSINLRQIGMITYFFFQIYLLEMNSEKSVENFKRAIELNPKFILSSIQGCYAQYLNAKHKSNELEAEKFMRKLKGFIIKYPEQSESYTLYAQVLCVFLSIITIELIIDNFLQL